MKLASVLLARATAPFTGRRCSADRCNNNGEVMARLRGIILDVDGTLVASNDAHAHAWLDALGEEGISVPFDKVRRCIGMGGDKLLPAVTGITEETPQGRRIS